MVKINEAIRILDAWDTNKSRLHTSPLGDAMKLGSEALKRELKYRNSVSPDSTTRLPGEEVSPRR
jgi:membrane protein required for beta-lactamase induction